MSSGKDGKEGKEGTIAKAAGAAVAVGVAWGIFRFLKAKKEEDALIQEYYGDREDFKIPGTEKDDFDADEVYIEEEIAFMKVQPPPPPLPPVDFSSHSDELNRVPEEEIKASEESEPHKPEPKVEEKPWFLRLFDPPKKTEGKSKFSESYEVRDLKPKESESYEIKKGDTLWAISGKYGIPLGTLKAANGLQGDNIYAGEKLVIPPQ
eukprot:c21039_g1_i1 orf=813-1433(-)